LPPQALLVLGHGVKPWMDEKAWEKRIKKWDNLQRMEISSWKIHSKWRVFTGMIRTASKYGKIYGKGDED